MGYLVLYLTLFGPPRALVVGMTTSPFAHNIAAPKKIAGVVFKPALLGNLSSFFAALHTAAGFLAGSDTWIGTKEAATKLTMRPLGLRRYCF